MNERTSGVRHATWVLRIALLLCGIGLLGATATARAADRAIEDIRFMKVNGVARADIVLACPVRYLSHTAATGAEVQIRIGLERECLAELGGGLRSELYDPPSGNLAGVREVVFDTTVEDRVARLSIRLTRTARFTVSQGPMRNVLRVQLDPNTAVSEPGDLVPDSAPLAPPPPTRPRAAPETNATEPVTPRQPLRLVQRSAARAELFVIQLAAGPEVAAGGALDTAPHFFSSYPGRGVASPRAKRSAR